MITNLILQNIAHGLNNITNLDITITEPDGKIAASTEDAAIYDVDSFINSPAEAMSVLGYQYFKAQEGGVTEYVVIVKGEGEEAYRVGKMAALSLQSLLLTYKERYDKDNFIKSLLQGQMPPIDIYSRAKKLRIENESLRALYLIETPLDKDLSALDVMRGIFPQKSKDFLTLLDDKNIVLIKEIRETHTKADIKNIAKTIYDTLGAEVMNKVYISIGVPVRDLKDAPASYKGAKTALDIGKVFMPEHPIIAHDNLGIGRLIYAMPRNICETFIAEVLSAPPGDADYTIFDEETITTAGKLFENNLNVSETARQLYIHRNTLVYRLDKIQRITGLDIRKLEDAVIFKITAMVARYISYMDLPA